MQARFFAEPDDVPPCPRVRTVFADLHHIPGNQADRKAARFGMIGSLDSIKPSGPYTVAVRTAYPEKAEGEDLALGLTISSSVSLIGTLPGRVFKRDSSTHCFEPLGRHLPALV